MQKLIPLYKPLGMTPLQAIQVFKQANKEYTDTPVSYAGRLDPMAEGLLLLLVGPENKQRKLYEDLLKTYECEVLFGVATDTYDILGKIVTSSSDVSLERQTIATTLQQYVGIFQQPYPPYSSKPVNGKPLYYWARNNKLDKISIPMKTIEIYRAELLAFTQMRKQDLQKVISERVQKVQGDFRQKDIMESWDTFFLQTNIETFPLGKLRIACSSGTYIRSIAHRLGQNLDTSALAFSITRTTIGKYSLEKALRIE